MKLLKDNLNITLVILLFLSLFTMFLGGSEQTTSVVGYAVICLIIVVKSSIIILNFMELKQSSPVIYIPMIMYVIFFPILIFLSYFIV